MNFQINLHKWTQHLKNSWVGRKARNVACNCLRNNTRYKEQHNEMAGQYN